MTVTLLERPTGSAPSDGRGLAARRAVVRWSWRLFRREWRQQLLVLALVVVAVAATVVGATVSTNNPPPANAGFGTAHDLATFSGNDAHLATQIASLEHRFGRVDVIDNRTLTVPGSTATFDLRAQDPHGAFGQPMLSLISGRYPTTAGEVALTPGLASDLGLAVGDVWHQGGTDRRVVGMVQNPQSLLDEFALVAPGEVASPTRVTVLFDAPGVPPASIGANVSTPATVVQNNPLNPETISLAVLTIGMLLIALVSVGGFTVLAQRRLRSLGMLASLGATPRQVGLVVRANGVVVGVVGALAGAILGFLAWLAYRPHLESSSHHLIGALSLPWLVVGLAMVLAVVAVYFAASRPARSVARIPVVTALSGRPAPPRKLRRSALPGLVLMFVAFLLLGYSGSTGGGNGNGGSFELVLGLLALIPAVILLAPFCLSVLSRLGRRAPVAPRVALRDLARYRARSGSALAAISIGVMIAVIIATAAASRYGDVIDYVGPNLASNQMVVYPPQGPPPAGSKQIILGGGSGGGQAAGGGAGTQTTADLASQERTVHDIAGALGAGQVVELQSPDAGIDYSGSGRQWSGQIYVATPQLLRAFGIKESEVDADADVLTSRPGLSGVSGLRLQGVTPVIQELGSLPAGTSAPNTVLTEHAIRTLGIDTSPGGWLVQTTGPITAVQIKDAQALAAATGMTVESKNDQPTSAEVINWATVFGMALALCILAMSVGLIRSETAGDLRTLSATGASSRTRRALTAATAGALGLTGAVLGTFAGYVGIIGWLRDNSLNGGISSLGNVPVTNLLLILVGMPLIAATGGWLLAGRQPPAMAHQPIE